MKVAVVIPAYNEAARLGAVLDGVCRSNVVNEIVVVSDGSTDSTARVARSFPGVTVLELPYNRGKGAALCAGVAATSCEVLVFIDADLVGLEPAHVDAIVRPILDRECEMCIGVFRGGRFWSDAAQRISPYISGQRALRRYLFEGVPYLMDVRMGVEVALNTFARRCKAKVLRVALRGVTHTPKERKLGLMKGTAARAKMYAEIGRAMVRSRRRREAGGRLHR